MHLPRFQIILSACLLFILGSAGCNRKIDEIRIGVIAPLSGPLAADYGKPTREGARLAVSRVNASGGLEVGGRKYKVALIVEDNRDKAETAVAAAHKLINQENVVAIVGLPLSRNAIPVSNVAERARVPMISCKSTNPRTTAGKTYVFRATFIDPFQGMVLARFAREELLADKAAVLFDVASAYNEGLAEAFIQTFEAAGGRIVALETYTTDWNKDFTSQMVRIRDSGANVLFLPNYALEVLRQAQQARQMGIGATLLGGDAWKPAMFTQHAEFENSFFSEVWHPDVANDRARAFLASYRQARGRDPKPYVPLTFDSVEMIFSAMQSQGSVEADAVRQGLTSMGPYNGISGTIEFKQGGDPIRSAVILQIKDGKTVLYKQVNP